MSSDERPLRLLSLDGGGIRGLSIIYVLKDVMRRLNLDRDKDLEPWQYFDMIGGTSTGGIIAIMLGRLQMTLDECERAYLDLSKDIFTPIRSSHPWIGRGVDFVNANGKFDATVLGNAIKKVIGRHSTSSEVELLSSPEPECKVFVCAIQSSRFDTTPVFLRTYKNNAVADLLSKKFKIWQACRATSAASTFFDPFVLQDGPLASHFLDGGIMLNNPVNSVFQEAQELWGRDRRMSLISVGTGDAPSGSFHGNLKNVVNGLAEIALDSRNAAEQFYSTHLGHPQLAGNYFRFNVSGMGTIGLEEHELCFEIEHAAGYYLQTGETRTKLEKCVEALLKTEIQDQSVQLNDADLKNIKEFTRDLYQRSCKYGDKNRIPQHSRNTCEWFLEHPNFVQWLQSTEASALWVTADAGYGKSVLAKFLIGHLQDGHKVIHFFFRHSRYDMNAMLCALLHQLLKLVLESSEAKSSVILHMLRDELKYKHGEQVMDEDEELWNIICHATTGAYLNSSKLFCVIDGLDECEEQSRSQFIKLIVSTFSSSGTVGQQHQPPNFLITSRPYLGIEEQFRPLSHIRIRLENETAAISRDIETMITNRIQNLNPQRFKPELQQYLHAEISRKAGRNFLWVKLILNALERLESRNMEEIRMLLDTTPTELDEFYRLVLESASNTTMKLFQWMCFSKEPLTVREMLHALYITPYSQTSSFHDIDLSEMHRSEENSKHFITTAANGLAIVIPWCGVDDNGKKEDTVAFVHESVRKFLLQRVFGSTSQKATAHLELSLASFCYIQLREIQERLAGFYDDRPIPELVEEFPLLKYATQHGATHARLASELGSNLEGLIEIIARRRNDSNRRNPFRESHPFDKDLDSAVRDAFLGPNTFTTNTSTLSTFFKASALWPSLRSNFFWPNPRTTVVHFCAKNGLFGLLRQSDGPDGFDWDWQDQYGRTSLSWAAECANVETVKLLRERGANVWKQDLCGETPFSWSAWRGNVDIARELLAEETHADLNSHNLLRQTPLCLAVQEEHIEMVDFLLEKNPDIDFRDFQGRTPLSWAAESGNLDIVKSLLEKGANPHITDEQDRTPLSYTARILGDDRTKSRIQHFLEEYLVHYKYSKKHSEKEVDISIADFASRPSLRREGSHSSSELSDVASIWSGHASSTSSRTSVGLTEEDYADATRRLADKISKQTGMPELYGKALSHFGKERFARYHDRLLKRLFQELGPQAPGETERYAVKIFRQKQKRDHVTGLIQDRVVETLQSKELAGRAKSKMTSYPMWRQLDTRQHGKYLDDDHWRDRTGLMEDVKITPSSAKVEEEDEEEDEEDEEEVQEEVDSEYADRELISGGVIEENIERALAFLVGGIPFIHFRESLEVLVDPSQTIEQALERQDSRGLRRLLKHKFSLVTDGSYRWLRELDAVGYSHDTMAQLLLEDAAEAPWIVFEPHDFVKSMPTVPFHHPGCAHPPIDDPPSESAQPRIFNSKLDLSSTVQELCGLGGILPISQDRSKWTGQCSFRNDDSSAALLTYNMSLDTKANHQHLILSILTALINFCTAAGHLQNAGFCCDSFTVIKKRECAPISEELELVRIKFDMPVLLCEKMQKVKEATKLTTENIGPCATIAKKIIELLHMPSVDSNPPESVFTSEVLSSHDYRPVAQSSQSCQQQTLDGALHICALAAQLLCVGLASFFQAHVGYFEPFFLNAELKEILMLGNLPLPKEEQKLHIPLIRVKLNKLTCLSKMTRGAVLVFSITSQQFEEAFPQEEPPRDLVCRIDELLETWGPGHCIPSEEDGSKIKTLELGGGHVYAVDVNNSKFHWEPGTGIEDRIPLPSFDRNTRMAIGALLTENPGCKFSEQQWDKCRRKCSSSLITLGAYRTYWKPVERQVGIEGGPSNFGISFNQTSIKHDGRSIKSTQLDEIERTDLLQFLGCSWGLQVSYCTGVARRVALKALVADLLPIFAKAKKQESMLQDWITEHNILQRLKEDDLQDLMHDLHIRDESVHQKLIWYMGEILNILKLTGVETGQNDLIIAWPHEKDLRRGVRIPCDKESYWVRILADSHLCATFAYMTNKCLESNSTPCKGADRRWLGTTAIMETAVSFYSVQEEPTMRDLEHGQYYHMQTLDSLVILKAQKDQQGIKLMVEKSAVSRRIQKRIFVKHAIRTQIREKQAPEDRAEQVLVSAGDFLTELLGFDLNARLRRR